MSKNFNQEYKNLVEQEVPDLWNRIEPALHEKKSTPVETKIDVPTKIIKFPMRRIMKYTGVLAACICLVILIPTFLYGTKNSSQSQDNSESKMTYDYESEGGTEATAESMEESAEEAMDEPRPDAADSAGNVVTEESTINEDVHDELKDSEIMEESPLAGEYTVFEGIQVYVVAIKQLPEGRYTYQVEIVNVNHDVFEEGLEIVINTDTQEMKKGRTYTVTIVGTNPNSQEENEYKLQDIEE